MTQARTITMPIIRNTVFSQPTLSCLGNDWCRGVRVRSARKKNVRFSPVNTEPPLAYIGIGRQTLVWSGEPEPLEVAGYCAGTFQGAEKSQNQGKHENCWPEKQRLSGPVLLAQLRHSESGLAEFG